MLYTNIEKIDDRIVKKLLENGPHTIAQFESSLNDKSRRAIFKSLRQLIDNGVVIKVKQSYLLNEEWVGQVRQAIDKDRIVIPEISPGDKITYEFKSLVKVDELWKSLYLSGYMNSSPTVFYNSHNIWPLVPGRQASEELYYQSLRPNKKTYFVIGSNTKLDQIFKKENESRYLKINLDSEINLDRRHFITINGNIIVQVILPLYFIQKIDHLYQAYENDPSVIKRIKQLLGTEVKVKMTIKQKEKKVIKLQKQLLKNFYVEN